VEGFDAAQFQVVSCYFHGGTKDEVNPRQGRQCTYDVTFWRFRLVIVSLETQQSLSFFSVYVHIGVSNTKPLSAATETQQWVPFALL
jgi:hypothetical protein